MRTLLQNRLFQIVFSFFALHWVAVQVLLLCAFPVTDVAVSSLNKAIRSISSSMHCHSNYCPSPSVPCCVKSSLLISFSDEHFTCPYPLPFPCFTITDHIKYKPNTRAASDSKYFFYGLLLKHCWRLIATWGPFHVYTVLFLPYSVFSSALAALTHYLGKASLSGGRWYPTLMIPHINSAEHLTSTDCLKLMQ